MSGDLPSGWVSYKEYLRHRGLKIDPETGKEVPDGSGVMFRFNEWDVLGRPDELVGSKKPREQYELVQLARSIDMIKASGRLPGRAQRPSPETPVIQSKAFYHEIMPQADTYAEGVHALRRACEQDPDCMHPMFVKQDGSRIYRPLTLRENLEACVTNYNSLKNPDGSKRTKEERLRLFAKWKDSCMAIGYKEKSTKFKLALESEELITIAEDFNKRVIPIDYPSFNGIELDSNDGYYDRGLSKDDVMKCGFWVEGVNDNVVLKQFRDIVWAELSNPDEAMGVYVRENTNTAHLRAVFVSSLDDYSDAFGDDYLGNSASFLRRVTQYPSA